MTEAPKAPLFDRICDAKDEIIRVRRLHGQQQATYDELKAAGIAYLELENEARRLQRKKVYEITPVRIAQAIR